MISIGALVYFVVYVLVLGLIVGLLWWLIHYVNPPEPFKKVAVVGVVVLSVLIIIGLLLNLIGYPVVRM